MSFLPDQLSFSSYRRTLILGLLSILLPSTSAVGAAAEHWAFKSPERPPIPRVHDEPWTRNPIDTFILARLESEQLAPSAEADRYTLIRRLYIDLLGLLPTPEEADAFAKDPRPDAYERLVDRLLASPHYGERWARRWLDLARYADTNGYEKDRERSIWPYRDWVIDAFNADMPFDRFTVKQIAGDMLPSPSLEDRIATGFHRNTMINEEGGIDVGEFRYYAVVDRVATTGTTWLGLTIACAQCHTHKYDPITHREYFEFLAFFNNADEPEQTVPDADVARKRAAIEQQLAGLQQKLLDSRLPQLIADGSYQHWQQQTRAKASHWTPLAPRNLLSERGATMAALEDHSVLVSGDIPNEDVYQVELQSPLPQLTALRLEVLPHPSLPAGGPGRAVFTSGAGEKGDFLLSEVSLEIATADDQQAWKKVPLAGASHSYAAKDRDAPLVIDGELDTGWSIEGRVGQPHHIVLHLASPLSQMERARLRVTLNQHYIHQMTIGRFRISATADPLPVESSAVPAEIEQILLLEHEGRSTQQQQLLARYYLSVAPELAEEQKQIADLRKQLPEHPTTMVMQERLPEHQRETFIHYRGEYLKPTEEVQPAIPSVLHELPADAPRNRLTLSRWLIDPHNPLVGRVVMNRHWASFFGRGIVETVEDFGTRGAQPSHPELLDWLATEWVRNGWSIKHMHRLVVTSATYRQKSAVTPELLERDPQNKLLARAPRLRVQAEIVRDLALDAAGLLTRQIGGPSVYPPQPDGILSLAYGKPTWTTSQGADRYRRGLYTFAKRTSPYATFATFDAPSGESCIAQRQRTNTPLQALSLLNDAVFVEAAQALARKVVAREASQEHTRAAALLRWCLTRPSEPEEVEWLVEFYRHQRQRLENQELDAAAIAGVQEDDQLPEDKLTELAAWTTVARALLNLDEMIVK